MRCRAWLKTRFCKNETKSLFCHVHQKCAPFINYFDKLPTLAIECIVEHIKTAEIRQTLRISSKILHDIIPHSKVQISKEYLYFKQFFLRHVVTQRQLNGAFQRFSKLSPQIQDTLKDELTVEIQAIRGCLTMRDMYMFNETFCSMLHQN
jgi:hypothetical protein